MVLFNGAGSAAERNRTSHDQFLEGKETATRTTVVTEERHLRALCKFCRATATSGHLPDLPGEVGLMRAELVRQGSGTLDRLPRALSNELDRIDQNALIKAAEVQAIGFVVRVGQAEIAAFSEMELMLSKASPTAAVRLQALGDVATAAISSVAASMIYRGVR